MANAKKCCSATLFRCLENEKSAQQSSQWARILDWEGSCLIKITPGSHAYRIIMLILITGEFPFQSLALLGDVRTLKAIATRLSKTDTVMFSWSEKTFEGRVVCISGKGKMKTMRLSKRVFPILREKMETELHQYLCLFQHGHFRGDKGRIERHHRLAEAIAFMMSCGIECSAHLIPQLQIMESIPIDFHEPAFYSSKYLKSVGNGEENKTQYTRMVGSLLTSSSNYIVYNTRDGVMNWHGQGEQKMLLNMETIVMRNSYNAKINSAILLGSDYDTALNTLFCYEAGEKNVDLINQGYEMIYFIPMSSLGKKLLQFLVLPNWKEELLLSVFTNDQLMVGKGSFTYDAMVDGIHILSFLDSDILKLSKFHRAVKQNGFPWAVYCFDFQVPFLRSYLGASADIWSIELEDIHSDLKAERKELL